MEDGTLHRIRARLVLDLHPSKLAAVAEGVREYLNGLLLQ
jgi:hypothetical protein